jgi:hypothetical protein
MTPETVASLLEKHVVEANVETYRMLFSSTSPQKATDEYWKAVLVLYAQLSGQQREVLVSVMRQVAIDTCANVIGVVENVNSLQGVKGKFQLRYDGEPVEQSVQDCFLELFE